MKMWNIFEKFIDIIINIFGKVAWVLVFYCMIFGVIEVFMRYVMNSPTLWISTTVQCAMVLLACFAGVYSYGHNAFVKLDLFYANFSERKKAAVDIITAIFAFMFLYIIVTKGYDAAILSIKMNQVTPTAIPIPIYLIKPFIPVAGIVIFMIAIKNFVNDIDRKSVV